MTKTPQNALGALGIVGSQAVGGFVFGFVAFWLSTVLLPQKFGEFNLGAAVGLGALGAVFGLVHGVKDVLHMRRSKSL